MSRIFLLSPAFCGGRRAGILLREGSDVPLAKQLQAGTLTLGEAFAFLSGLYFRGKLAYGRAFGRRADGASTLVITPSRGLVSPDAIVDAALLREFAGVDVALDNPRYRAPLDRDAAALASALDPHATVVLLGSVASGKYGDALAPWFGDRLCFPTDFIGRGDMSRGGLLLRRAASGEELAYACLRSGDRPTGGRPPKLPRATVLLAGLTLFCSPQTAPRVPAPVALSPCAIGGVAAECGSIHVFENRETKRGRQIDIHFAVVRGHTATPKRAVFEFAGGPGQSSVELAATADGWIAPLRQAADLVFVDQRGTGQSHSLACEPAGAAPASGFGHVFDPALVTRCRAALEADADLTQYTSDIAAADIDDVRATLGYESISIYGVSYGTRLALTYMRRFPTRVRVAVLDGVVPPDLNVPLTYAASAEASLEKVFAACAADLLCGIRHPHVAEHFHDLLQRLDKGPLDATVRGEEAERINVKMSRGDFGYAVRGLLYTAGIASRLAGMIDDAAGSGRLDAFAQAYVDRQRSLERTIAFGQHLSVFCAEDVPFATDAEIATAAAGTFLGRYLFDEYRAACRGWPRAAIAADARTPVTSRVPTLLVSGAFDPVTPPAFAEHVQRGLPLARWIVSPTAAHGAAAGCPRSLVLADLEHGSIDAIGDECRR